MKKVTRVLIVMFFGVSLSLGNAGELGRSSSLWHWGPEAGYETSAKRQRNELNGDLKSRKVTQSRDNIRNNQIQTSSWLK